MIVLGQSPSNSSERLKLQQNERGGVCVCVWQRNREEYWQEGRDVKPFVLM